MHVHVLRRRRGIEGRRALCDRQFGAMRRRRLARARMIAESAARIGEFFDLFSLENPHLTTSVRTKNRAAVDL